MHTKGAPYGFAFFWLSPARGIWIRTACFLFTLAPDTSGRQVRMRLICMILLIARIRPNERGDQVSSKLHVFHCETVLKGE